MLSPDNLSFLVKNKGAWFSVSTTSQEHDFFLGELQIKVLIFYIYFLAYLYIQ